MILLSPLLDEEYEAFILILINGKSSLSYNDVPTALVNHKVRRKDKVSSSNSTTLEALTARGMSFNHQKRKSDVDKSKIGSRELERTSVLSARKKDNVRLIVQGSRRKRDQNQRQTSHRQMMI